MWKLEKCDFNLYSYMDGNNTLYFGNAPDNPSVRDVSYIIKRIKGKQGTFINVFEATPKETTLIKNVSFNVDADKVEVIVSMEKKVKKHIIIL